MTNNLNHQSRRSIKFWWTSIVIGIATMILGLWAAASPNSVLLALVIVFGINFIASGILEIGFAISNRNSISGWGWRFTSGVIDIVFGYIILMLPLTSVITLILFMGFWLLFQSIWSIGSALELRRYRIRGWILLLLFSILSVILAIILITNPISASKFIALLFAASLIWYGIQRIIYAFWLKRLDQRLKES